MKPAKATKKLWYFEWKGGGYNSVLATSKKQAIKLATEMGKPSGGMTVTLIPIPSTFTTDQKKQVAMDRKWFMD
jgi:hypothetical protein